MRTHNADTAPPFPSAYDHLETAASHNSRTHHVLRPSMVPCTEDSGASVVQEVPQEEEFP
jgi:hypothetical protein